MNRELLEKPFDRHQIKQREGAFGSVLDYVEGHVIIHRLNDAFDAEWSFDVLSHEVHEDRDEVIVLGQLTAGSITKSQFGTSRITRARETGDIVSLGQDLKAAATDALKKAATLLGVGLSLYGNGNGNQHAQGSRRQQSGDKGSQNGNGRSNPGNGNGRLTSKQHSYILRLMADCGMTRNELNQKCLNTYGVGLDYLSRSDASSLIESLR